MGRHRFSLRVAIVALVLTSTPVAGRAQDVGGPRKPRPTSEASVTAAVDISTTAEIAVQQTGRIVGGQSTGGLRDSFACVLGGIDVDGVRLMAGGARVFGWPTANGKSILPHSHDDTGRYAPAGGIDW